MARTAWIKPVREIMEILLRNKGQENLKGYMARGTAGTFGLKTVNIFLSFGTSMLLARLLGPKEYGIYAYAVSWASLVSIPAVMGLNALLVREVARYQRLENWGAFRGIISWSDRVVLATSTGFAALFALMVWALPGWFVTEVRMPLWIGIALVPLLAFLLLRQGRLQGLGYVVEAQVPSLIVLPILFLGLSAILHFTIGLDGTTAIALRLVAGLIAVLFASFLLRKHSPRLVTHVPPLYRQREWLKSAFPLLFIGAAGIVSQYLIVAILGTMRGPELAGVLDVSIRGASFVFFPLVAVTAPLAPLLSRLYIQGNRECMQRVINKSVKWAGILGAAIAALFLFFGSVFLKLFGDQFAGGFYALAILSIGNLISMLLGPVVNVYTMTGNEAKCALGIAFGIMLTGVLSVVLIPSLGLEGAAIAWIIGELGWKAAMLVRAKKDCGVFPTIKVWRRS